MLAVVCCWVFCIGSKLVLVHKDRSGEQNYANYLIMILSCFAVYTGAQLQCSQCKSLVSYDDCQNKTTVVNCSSVDDHACFQANVKFEKGADKILIFQKGCLQKGFCEAYSKGEIGECITRREQGYEVDCRALCCHENECNMKDLLAEDNKGSAFAISIMNLLFGLLLTLVSIN